MTVSWKEFESEYLDLASDVAGANNTTYEQRLQDFIAEIDNCSWASARVADLAPGFNFEKWYEAALATTSSMAGSGSLDWAKNRKERLGQQLALFRHFSENAEAYLNFSANFMYSGSRLDDMIAEINSQLFNPFARDLLKDLYRHSPIETKSDDAPASDRVVSVDHNSAGYQEVQSNLQSLEEAVRASNSLGDAGADERDRFIAEISATRRLLQASRVRLQALWTLVVPCLKWLAEKVADNIVQITISALIAALVALFGMRVPGL